MLRMKFSRRWFVLTCGLVISGILAGAVVAAQFGDGGAPEGLRAAIDTEQLVRVADIPAEGTATRRGVFVQPTSAGFVCLWDAPNARSLARQGGCNPQDDRFSGRAMMISFSYDGGPSVSDVKDARLIGLVSRETSAVEVLMNDGARRAMKLHATKVDEDEYRAFGYRFKKADLRQGIAPTAVVALDAEGREIDRQATGFAG